jgi:hypothetical protein
MLKEVITKSAQAESPISEYYWKLPIHPVVYVAKLRIVSGFIVVVERG